MRRIIIRPVIVRITISGSYALLLSLLIYPSECELDNNRQALFYYFYDYIIQKKILHTYLACVS